LRTLFIASGAPYPARGGAEQRWWQNINILATRGPVHVLSIGARQAGVDTMPVAAEWVHIDSAEFPATRSLRALFTRLIAQRQYPLPVLATPIVNKRLRAMIERVDPDIIVLSHWKNSYPAPLKKCSNVILDMHNVESLIGTDLQHIKSPFVRGILSWRWRARERALVRNASRTWVCGSNDVGELKRLDPRLPAPIVWPNAVDLELYREVREGKTAFPAGLQRNGATLIFVGLYSYKPNRLAATELLEKLIPLTLARMPQARFVFVGGAPTGAMIEAAQRDPRIIVTGRVDDVRQYLALADVCVVPIRTGGGTRAKILECFAAKIPVVSTAKGVEGIEVVAGREIRIAESPEALTEGALELLKDPAARARQADAAFDLVRRLYSWSSLANQIDESLPPSAGTRETRLPQGAST